MEMGGAVELLLAWLFFFQISDLYVEKNMKFFDCLYLWIATDILFYYFPSCFEVITNFKLIRMKIYCHSLQILL